jgi:hypothetical protein
MSYIRLELFTDTESKDISIQVKSECTLNELEVATGALMGMLATQSTTGIEVLKSLLSYIEGVSDEGTNDTEEHN